MDGKPTLNSLDCRNIEGGVLYEGVVFNIPLLDGRIIRIERHDGVMWPWFEIEVWRVLHHIEERYKIEVNAGITDIGFGYAIMQIAGDGFSAIERPVQWLVRPLAKAIRREQPATAVKP